MDIIFNILVVSCFAMPSAWAFNLQHIQTLKVLNFIYYFVND